MRWLVELTGFILTKEVLRALERLRPCVMWQLGVLPFVLWADWSQLSACVEAVVLDVAVDSSF